MNLHGVPTMMPLAATSQAAGSTGSTGSSESAGQQAQDTFISLLVAELKAQDPTQPMSPTEMVGQMFSMNQLQQLISINQILTDAFSPLTGGTPSSGAPGTGTPTGGH